MKLLLRPERPVHDADLVERAVDPPLSVRSPAQVEVARHAERSQRVALGQLELGDGLDPPVQLDDADIAAEFTVTVSTGSQPRVVVSDQTLAANRLVVDAVSALVAGFVAVHRLDGAGQPRLLSNLGAAPVPAGVTERLGVTLTDYVFNGEELAVVLYADLGSAGAFEPLVPDARVQVGPTPVQAVAAVTTTPESQPRVRAGDQVVADNSVTVAEVSTLFDGFVVVHRTLSDGSADTSATLGAVQLDTGHHTDVPVELTGYVGDRERLVARLYHDLGTLGVFDGPDTDEPAVLGTRPVQQAFTVTVAAPSQPRVTIFDQVVRVGDDLSVSVARVNTFADGWIVIRRSDGDGAPISPGNIGTQRISAGVSSYVRVVLTDNVEDGERLHAALHIDAGTPNVYQFPGVDEPVRLGDRIVATPFLVSVPWSPNKGARSCHLVTYAASVRLPSPCAPCSSWPPAPAPSRSRSRGRTRASARYRSSSTRPTRRSVPWRPPPPPSRRSSPRRTTRPDA